MHDVINNEGTVLLCNMFGKEQRQRNLNYAETLDKLLGTDDKGRITQNIDANLKTTPQQRLERPATRHGRQTIEKPSDAATTASSVIATDGEKQTDRWQRVSDSETQSSDNDSSIDNEFIERLNDIRRTSVKINAAERHSDEISTSPSQTQPGNMHLISNQSMNDSSHGCSSNTVDSNRPLSTTTSKSSSNSTSRKNSAKENNTSYNSKGISPCIPTKQKSANSHNSQRALFQKQSNSSDNTANKKALKQSNSAEKQKAEANSSSLIETSTNEKRSSSHEKWLREKRIREKEKRKEMKEKEDEQKRLREERRKEAEKSFLSWKERADAIVSEKKKLEKNKEEMLRKEQTEEKEKRRVEAQKMFEAWKRERLQQLSTNKSVLKQKEEALKKKAEDETTLKRIEAQKVFQSWCDAKRTKEIEMLRKNMELRRNQETQSRNEKEYKDALAKEAYDSWLETKKQERAEAETLHGRILRFEDDAHSCWSVPWIPPSNTIPRKFTPTNRRRQSVKTKVFGNRSLITRSRSAHG